MVEIKQDSMYLVNEQGFVFSKFTNKFLKLSLAANGYSVVNIRVNGKRQPFYVHRLVAEAFLEIDESRTFVNHKNGIKTDNRVENLEWVTDAENKTHAKQNGLTAKGSKTNKGVLDEQIVNEICKLLSDGLSSGEIVKALGYPVTRDLVLNIRSRRDWKQISEKYFWKCFPSRKNNRVKRSTTSREA